MPPLFKFPVMSVGCMFLLFLSCTHQVRVEEFETSIGLLKQEDLIHRFGYPQRLKKIPPGIEVWDYEFLAGNSRCVGYRVYFDESQRSERWERIGCR